MHLEGRHVFHAPVQAVWDTLLDPECIAACVPGRERFEQTGPDMFVIGMKVRIGPVGGSGEARIHLSDQTAPERYRMTVEGGGPIGHIRGAGVLRLSADGDRTVVEYEGQADISGKIASVGQRLLGASAKLLIGQFFSCMERKVAG